MVKTLVIKELRECAAITALAVLAMGYALASLMLLRLLLWQTVGDRTFPFVYDGANFYFSFIVGGLAVALGLKQAAWEDVRGTYHFLLHRPMCRSRIVQVKLATGATILLVFAGVAIVLYALWAATPGKHASPFYWSMTEHAWVGWIEMPIVYFAAFLSGLRPGRWFGTRLLPLVTGIACALLLDELPWRWLVPPLSLAMCVVLVVGILHVARERDY